MSVRLVLRQCVNPNAVEALGTHVVTQAQGDDRRAILREGERTA